MAGYDALSDFVNQEADYNFASGLEMLKKAGGQFLDATSPFSPQVSEPLNQDIKGFADYVNQSAVGRAAASGAQAMQETGADYGIPVGPMMGVIRSNMRTPQQIQALRKTIAEEMRSRGPVADISTSSPVLVKDMPPGSIAEAAKKMKEKLGVDKHYTPRELLDNPDVWPYNKYEGPDPIDLILRGTPYHGLSSKARSKVISGENFDLYDAIRYNQELATGYYDPASATLQTANYRGFPISLHNSESMSNKWGEPAGVSTSFLPTKSGTMFSPDEYIHRLLPLYGGPPRERIVNLMEEGGREVLRDAYTGAFGKLLTKDDPYALNRLATYSKDSIDNPLFFNPLERTMRDFQQSSDLTGKFNLGLSNELQSMGKRGILYNPQRYDEYEMLMLDPKYILPLDYRKFQEYANAGWRKGKNYSGLLDIVQATPGVRKGLEQIQDVMSQNHSRLGDIYSERPWQGYLTPEVKESLLQRVGPDYREQVGNMLEGRGAVPEVGIGEIDILIQQLKANKELAEQANKPKKFNLWDE